MSADIATAVIGLFGALIGGGLTSATTWSLARAERHKFARERTWDIRRAAYTQIISGLVAATTLAESMSENIDEDPRYVGSPHCKVAMNDFDRRFKAMRDGYYEGRLVLSKDFVEKYDAFLKEVANLKENSNKLPPELASSLASTLDKWKEILVDIAVREVAPT